MRKFLLTGVACLVVSLPGFSQSITNVGTDFWIAFPPNYSGFTLKILISSQFATSGTVHSSYPGVDQNFTVAPGVVTQLTIPSGAALVGGIENKGVRITSADPIAVYGHNWRPYSTDAYLALPVNALGTDYRVLTYKAPGYSKTSHFSLVASDDNTLVTVHNQLTNADTSFILNKGQTYMDVEVTSLEEDVSGTWVRSDKPIAVYGSVDCDNIPSQACAACDHIVEEMFPYYSWGKNFVTVSLAGRDGSGDIFRVLSGDDGNEVTINGTPAATIDSGQFYQIELPGYNVIKASKPALVAQYAKGISCSGTITGDPLMMLILPCEQFLTNYTIINVAGFTSHWVNLVAPDYALGTISQDGVLIPAAAFTQIGTTNYYGAQRSVTEDSHVFTSTFPFGVFVYGWNQADSYGYPGGGSLSPVGTVQHVTLEPDTSYGQLNVTSICLTATVTNNLSNPVEGVLVNFNINGVTPLVGNAYTDSLGQAVFCYTQLGVDSGIDLVYADVFGFTSDTAVVIWTYIPPCDNPTTGGAIGNDQSGCGTYLPVPLVSLSLPTGENGTLEYLWQISTSGGLSGFTDIPGSNASFFSPDSVYQTSWFRRLARVDCMSDWSGAALSNVVELTVVPPVPVSVTISSAPDPFCMGSPVTFAAIPVNGGTLPVFQWKVNGSPAGTNSPTFVYQAASGDQVECILTSGLACVSGNPAHSNMLVMTGNPVPLVTFTPCFDTVTSKNARPIKLKGGIPLGGTYSGPGVFGGYFDPGLAGTGTRIITYSYTNAFLCSGAAMSRIHNYAAPLFTCGNQFTDLRDNRKYSTILIGGQCWMSQDLDFGSQISEILHQTDNCAPEKYKSAPGSLQTALYQWDELMGYEVTPGLQGLCPPGWHIPTEAEWTLLFSNWTNNGFAAGPLKYSGYSGFNALMVGAHHLNRQWDYTGFAAFFWSSEAHGPYRAWAHGMNDPDPSVSTYPSLRSNAFSVRCLHD
jgi:uncharacterized protein (TIGR02145 family)